MLADALGVQHEFTYTLNIVFFILTPCIECFFYALTVFYTYATESRLGVAFFIDFLQDKRLVVESL